MLNFQIPLDGENGVCALWYDSPEIIVEALKGGFVS